MRPSTTASPSPKRPARLGIVAAIALIAGFAVVTAVRRAGDGEAAAAMVHVTGETMATVYSVKVVGQGFPPGAEQALRARVDGVLERVDERLSRYRRGSDLDRFNRARTTEPREIPPALAEVLAEALEISRLTGGAYDVTVGPLVELWGFDEKRSLARAPSAARIAAVRERVGYEKLVVDRASSSARKLHPELDVDLSSIAKGYGVDRLALALEEDGHHNFMVEVGGEVRCRGESPRGGPWRVAVERPLEDRREIYEVVEMRDRAMATSGDYRSFYRLGDRRVSHTIDPRTGEPVSHRLASVTVVDERCVRADGLATAISVLGPEAGLALAEELDLAALLLVREKGGALAESRTGAFDALAGGAGRGRGR